jgi:hypothetical protein
MTAMRGADADVAGGRGAPRGERPEIGPIRDEYAPDEGHDDVGLNHPPRVRATTARGLSCPYRPLALGPVGQSRPASLVLIEGHAGSARSGEPARFPDGTNSNRVSTIDIQES